VHGWLCPISSIFEGSVTSMASAFIWASRCSASIFVRHSSSFPSMVSRASFTHLPTFGRSSAETSFIIFSTAVSSPFFPRNATRTSFSLSGASASSILFWALSSISFTLSCISLIFFLPKLFLMFFDAFPNQIEVNDRILMDRQAAVICLIFTLRIAGLRNLSRCLDLLAFNFRLQGLLADGACFFHILYRADDDISFRVLKDHPVEFCSDQHEIHAEIQPDHCQNNTGQVAVNGREVFVDRIIQRQEIREHHPYSGNNQCTRQLRTEGVFPVRQELVGQHERQNQQHIADQAPERHEEFQHGIDGRRGCDERLLNIVSENDHHRDQEDADHQKQHQDHRPEPDIEPVSCFLDAADHVESVRQGMEEFRCGPYQNDDGNRHDGIRFRIDFIDDGRNVILQACRHDRDHCVHDSRLVDRRQPDHRQHDHDEGNEGKHQKIGAGCRVRAHVVFHHPASESLDASDNLLKHRSSDMERTPENIAGYRIVLLPCPDNRLLEIRLIDRIRIMLRLQCKA